jgi:hypothetical protein
MNARISVSVLAGAALSFAAPATASAQGGLLGPIGQVITDATQQVSTTLDQVLGGGTSALPPDALGDVLSTVLAPPAAPGAPGAPGLPGVPGSAGAPGAGGPAWGGSGASGGSNVRLVGGGSVAGTSGSSGPAGSVLDDGRAPMASVRIVSRLSRVAATRRLRVEVRSDEPGVVAFSSTIRPGVKRRGVAKRVAHSRSVIHVPTVVLAFRSAGTLTVDLRLRAADAARLGRARNGRMSVGILTADVARNQSSERLKRHLRR